MRYLFARLFSILGIASLARRLMVRDGRFVLVFHSIIQQRYENLAPLSQAGLTAAELDRVIRWVKRRFDLLTPNQFLESDRPGVLLTFDDGMANNYTHALPILEQHDAPAVFFVSTQHVLDPRDWLPYTRRKAHAQWDNLQDVPEEWARELFDGMAREQVAACARHPLITVGSHTITHPFLTRCDAARLERELVGSRRQLEAITGQAVDLLAYPTGDYDRRVAEAVRTAGYRAAFALIPKGVGMPLYEIPRIGIEWADAYYLDVKLSGLYHRPVGRLLRAPGHGYASRPESAP
jgi:peptidoglycan/xylan/chitin deacetylase (PgdA/CDA1 family)